MEILTRTDLINIEDILSWYINKMQLKQTRFTTAFNIQFHREEEDTARAVRSRVRECIAQLKRARIESEPLSDTLGNG